MSARKFLSGIDNSNQRIINLADGQTATDAVTLQQLQAYVKGLSWKQAVIAASTTNMNVSSGLLAGTTMDGITLATGDRVLLKNQTTASENGIYVVPASGGAVRSTDAAAPGGAPDGIQTLTGGMATYVEKGTVNADTAYVLTTDDPIVVGTTNLTFVQFGGSNVYTAGNGIQLSSGAFSVRLAPSSGLVVDGTGLYIDSSLIVRKYASAVGDGSSTQLTVAHNLNTRDVIVRLYDATTFAEVETDVVHATTTTVVLNFGAAPASGAYRCVVHA